MDVGALRGPSTASSLIEAALAPTTRSFYTRVWHNVGVDHLPGGVMAFPMPVSAVADYLAALFDKGCSSSTLTSHASAIAYGHKIRGLPDPTSHFHIKQLLQGARRLRASIDHRKALTLDDIIRLSTALYAIGLRRVDRTAFRTIFLLGFFGLLRPGELVRGANSQHTLKATDISLSGGVLIVRIPSSKTSVTPQTITITARPGLDCCPVKAMQDFLQVRPNGGSQLFIDAAGAPIDSNRLSAIMKQAARVCGMDSVGISGHCLRIGGASHGAMHGMTELQLAEAGRWRSRAVRRYVRRNMSVLSVT